MNEFMEKAMKFDIYNDQIWRQRHIVLYPKVQMI